MQENSLSLNIFPAMIDDALNNWNEEELARECGESHKINIDMHSLSNFLD